VKESEGEKGGGKERAGAQRAKERPADRLPGLPGIEFLLPLACLGAAVVLGLSELLDTFVLTDAGDEPVREVSALDRHGGAMLMLAVFAIVALGLAAFSGSKAAAFAVAAAGTVALLIFLTTDLPDANQVGALSEPGEFLANAEAEPAAGFWLQLLGSLALAVSGAALATLTPEQLALRDRLPRRERPAGGGASSSPTETGGKGERSKSKGKNEPKSAPPRRRRVETEDRPDRVKDRVDRFRRAASRRRSD
jgi:hypothetical protein